MKFLPYIIAVLLSINALAQDESNVVVFPKSVTDFAIDDNDNLYTVDELGNVEQYNKDLKLVNDYRSISNGSLHSIDASNPLQLLLNYSDNSKLVILDRMLTPKLDLDLTNIDIFNPEAIAQSRDGSIWIYDEVEAKLRKINEQLETVSETNDLRLSGGEVVQPTCIREQNGRVVMCDPQNGIYIFDRFGTFVNKLDITGVSDFQLLDDYLIYIDKTLVYSYDFIKKSFNTSPVKIAKADKLKMSRTKQYILKNKKLTIFPTIQ